MAAKSRLLGKEVQIRMALGGVPLTTITAIKSFVFNINHKILDEQYLGESSERKDSVFSDVSGNFTIHPESPDALVFAKALADKAIARSAGEQQVTITLRCTFPSGQTAKVTIPNPEFDPTSFNVGGRDSYTELSFSFKAESFTLTV